MYYISYINAINKKRRNSKKFKIIVNFVFYYIKRTAQVKTPLLVSLWTFHIFQNLSFKLQLAKYVYRFTQHFLSKSLSLANPHTLASAWTSWELRDFYFTVSHKLRAELFSLNSYALWSYFAQTVYVVKIVKCYSCFLCFRII